MSMFIRSDLGANFARTIEIDLSRVEPMAALPHRPTNGVCLSALSERPVIARAFIGSCTGGNLTDLKLAAEVLKHKKVHNGVELVIQPASMAIYERAEQEGILDVFKEAGVEVLLPGCGACIGLGPGRMASSGEVMVSATNRNFPGRMGERGEIYLASPATAVASSVRGYLCSPLEI